MPADDEPVQGSGPAGLAAVGTGGQLRGRGGGRDDTGDTGLHFRWERSRRLGRPRRPVLHFVQRPCERLRTKASLPVGPPGLNAARIEIRRDGPRRRRPPPPSRCPMPGQKQKKRIGSWLFKFGQKEAPHASPRRRPSGLLSPAGDLCACGTISVRRLAAQGAAGRLWTPTLASPPRWLV